jgi:hypothetical protein
MKARTLAYLTPQHFYYKAKSEDDFKVAKSYKGQIFELEDEIEELKEQFLLVRSG